MVFDTKNCQIGQMANIIRRLRYFLAKTYLKVVRNTASPIFTPIEVIEANHYHR